MDYPYFIDTPYPDNAAEFAASLVRLNVDFTCQRVNTDGAVYIRFSSYDISALNTVSGYQVFEAETGKGMI